MRLPVLLIKFPLLNWQIGWAQLCPNYYEMSYEYDVYLCFRHMALVGNWSIISRIMNKNSLFWIIHYVQHKTDCSTGSLQNWVQFGEMRRDISNFNPAWARVVGSGYRPCAHCLGSVSQQVLQAIILVNWGLLIPKTHIWDLFDESFWSQNIAMV